MILVTGATGDIGGEVVRQLVGAGEKVRAMARDPAKAAKLGPAVEVARGDLLQPETLASSPSARRRGSPSPRRTHPGGQHTPAPRPWREVRVT